MRALAIATLGLVACSFDTSGISAGGDASPLVDGATFDATTIDGSATDATADATIALVDVTFTDGPDYSGTRDTFLSSAEPDTNFGTRNNFEWDTVENGGVTTGLIRFDNIFGGGTGQIPANATITSATLELSVYDPAVLPLGELWESAVPWGETSDRYNTFGGEPGIQQDELLVFVANVPFAINRHAIDVTTSLVRWHTGVATNFGWIIVPKSTDGEHSYSREESEPSRRPALLVSYQVPL